MESPRHPYIYYLLGEEIENECYWALSFHSEQNYHRNQKAPQLGAMCFSPGSTKGHRLSPPTVQISDFIKFWGVEAIQTGEKETRFHPQVEGCADNM